MRLLGLPEDPRTRLALLVTYFSITVVGVLSVAIIWKDKDGNGAQLVLTGVLPLLGTWVGTILAYYFSKENFEAAASSERQRMKLLQSKTAVSALSVARKLAETKYGRMPESMISLAHGNNVFEIEKVERLPVLDDARRPCYMMHSGTVNEFITTHTLTPDELKALTLETLLQKDKSLLPIFRDGFATVSHGATLVEAKRAMEAIPKCEDVFVTEDGTRNTAVLGWLSNSRILRFLDD